jgi:hypothetical protein
MAALAERARLGPPAGAAAGVVAGDLVLDAGGGRAGAAIVAMTARL